MVAKITLLGQSKDGQNDATVRPQGVTGVLKHHTLYMAT